MNTAMHRGGDRSGQRHVRPSAQTPLRLCSLLAVAALTVCMCGCELTQGVDKKKWVSENEKILAEIPVYPGSTPDSERSVGMPTRGSIENGPPYSGYITTHRFKLPRKAKPGSVVNYYNRYARSDGWSCGITACNGYYRRGDAIFIVAAYSTGLLELSVDHHAPH